MPAWNAKWCICTTYKNRARTTPHYDRHTHRESAIFAPIPFGWRVPTIARAIRTVPDDIDQLRFTVLLLPMVEWSTGETSSSAPALLSRTHRGRGQRIASNVRGDRPQYLKQLAVMTTSSRSRR